MHKKIIIDYLLNFLDGAILQGDRTINACLKRETVINDYHFEQGRFELGLYIHCLHTILFLLQNIRYNKNYEKLRIEEVQKIKSIFETNINWKLLIKVRNMLTHPEKPLIGGLRENPLDVINDGVPYSFVMQIINDEIIVSDKQCAKLDEHGSIKWLVDCNGYISIQKSFNILTDIRQKTKKNWSDMNVW